MFAANNRTYVWQLSGTNNLFETKIQRKLQSQLIYLFF